jgi:hypothetical protein
MRLKLLAREPTKKMVQALRLSLDDEHCSDFEALRRVFDVAPDIESEAEKVARIELAERFGIYSPWSPENDTDIGKAIEIIRALLCERGKI